MQSLIFFKENKKIIFSILILLSMLIICLIACPASFSDDSQGQEVKIIGNKIFLPRHFIKGNLSVFDSIETRRSVRDYGDEPLTVKEISTLLYVTQGITGEGKRAAPSAGALYPIETYLVANNIEGLEKGLYHYVPEEHSLEIIKIGDFRNDIKKAGFLQDSLEKAAVDFIWTAVFERTTQKYGEKGVKFIYLEAGHISENLYLQANSIGLGAVSIGGFNDEEVNSFLGVDGEKESVIYINAVGRRK